MELYRSSAFEIEYEYLVQSRTDLGELLMNKTLRGYLSFFLILLFFLMSGCSDFSQYKIHPISHVSQVGSVSSSLKVPSGYTAHKLIFPVSQTGKTKDNASIYQLKPFTLSFILPKNWRLQQAGSQSNKKSQPFYLYKGLYSVIDIMDGKKCVGAIGYNTYKLYKGAENLPSAIFSQIDLGSGYSFDVHDAYKPVKTIGSMTTAITDVDYSANFMARLGLTPTQKTNWGILCHDKKRLVYVAAEFDKRAETKKRINAIANSFQIS